MFLMAARLPDPRAKIIDDTLFQFGLSYRWLAEKIGRSHVAVSDWLKGNAKPQKASVWDDMLRALSDYQQTQQTSGNVKVKRIQKLTVAVLPVTLDSLHRNDVQTGVYMETVSIIPPDDGRELWARKVMNTKLSPLAEPSDVLLFDIREPEIGHIVDAMYQGKAVQRVLSGTTARPVLVTTDPSNPEAISEDFAIRGVASIKVEQKPGGIKVTTEYEYGMYHRP